MKKIFIGKVSEHFEHGSIAGEKIYLTKHSWDCDWYWGFGYIGNKDLHTHFNIVFLETTRYTPKEIFDTCIFDSKTWWVLRDLFVQAYALKKAAEIYQHGGHQTTLTGTTDMIKDLNKAEILNKDLEKILNKIWEIVLENEGNIKK